ncbi:hypothetical protein X975_02864, partial [Stegodyphus mimosarum]
MRKFALKIFFIWSLLSCVRPHMEQQNFGKEHHLNELEERQLGAIGLTVLGALTLPILIPVGVARLVSRLVNLGNSSSSTGVTVRPVILPGRPLRRPQYKNYHKDFFSERLIHARRLNNA